MTKTDHLPKYQTWDEFLADFVKGSLALLFFVALIALAGAFETWMP